MFHFLDHRHRLMIVAGHLLNRLMHCRIKGFTDGGDRFHAMPGQHTNNLLDHHPDSSDQVGGSLVGLGRLDGPLQIVQSWHQIPGQRQGLECPRLVHFAVCSTSEVLQICQ